MIAPASYEEAAAALREAAAARRSLRIRGAGTKLGWAAPVDEPDVWLSTGGLAAIVEHNAGDLTAVLEAGVRLEDAQDAFAEAGQMLALDPPGAEATVGGVVATGDAGPLRHRYGGPRDLLLGATVALADGTVARSGGKVIKNVAGYDLAKLFAGSFGTLGAIGQVVVRLHPRPPERATVTGETDDPEELGRAAVALAAAPLELEALDVRWSGGRGALVAQAGGVALAPRIQRLRDLLGQAGLAPSVVRDDGDVWSAQRSGQRSADGLVVRVSALPTALARVLRLADRLDAAVVGRAGLGLSWLRLPPRPELVGAVRRELAPSPCVVLDAPPELRAEVDAWGPVPEGLRRLAARVKERFDPEGVCGPALP